MKKTVLITGGAGFIGSNFARHLYDRYPSYKIVVVDSLTYAGSVENLPVKVGAGDERFSFWYGDVKNAHLMDTLIGQADVVVHFAAETHVTRSIYDNFLFFETDVIGTQTVANAVLKHAKTVERFIHISTSEVYGTAETPKMDEEHPLKPMSPYAAAKAGADRLVYSYWATYKLPAIIARPFNQYGPRQHLEKAVARFITSCILDEPINIHGDGGASRDYLYVGDLCAALDLLMHADLKKVAGGIYNVASEKHRSMLSVAQDVVRVMKRGESLIRFRGERPGQVFRHTGDTKRLRKLGWKPKVGWLEGLELTARWYRENRGLWEKQLWMRHVPIITASGKRDLH